MFKLGKEALEYHVPNEAVRLHSVVRKLGDAIIFRPSKEIRFVRKSRRTKVTKQ